MRWQVCVLMMCRMSELAGQACQTTTGARLALTWRLPSVGSLKAFSLLESSLLVSMEKTSLGGTSSLQPRFLALGALTGAGTGAARFAGACDFALFAFSKHLQMRMLIRMECACDV